MEESHASTSRAKAWPSAPSVACLRYLRNILLLCFPCTLRYLVTDLSFGLSSLPFSQCLVPCRKLQELAMRQRPNPIA